METTKIEPLKKEFITKSEFITYYLEKLNNDYDGFELIVGDDSLVYFKKYKYNKYRCKYYFKTTIFLNRFLFKNYFSNKKGKTLFIMDLFNFEQVIKVYTFLKNILLLDNTVSIELDTASPISKDKKIESTSNLLTINIDCLENYLIDLNNFYNGFKINIIEYNILKFFKFAKAEYGYRYKLELTIFFDRYKSKDIFKNKEGLFNFDMELFDFQQVLDINRLLINIFFSEDVTIQWKTFKPFG